MIEGLLEQVGWTVPDCPVCGEPMLLMSLDVGSRDAKARFAHCSPRAHGHAYSSPLFGGKPGVCVLCKQWTGEFAPGPCPAVDPLVLDEILFHRVLGVDRLEVVFSRG